MPELDLDAFKSRLTEERSRVAAAIDYLEFENAGSMEDEGEEAGIGNHLAETASATLDREIDLLARGELGARADGDRRGARADR